MNKLFQKLGYWSIAHIDKVLKFRNKLTEKQKSTLTNKMWLNAKACDRIARGFFLNQNFEGYIIYSNRASEIRKR